MSEVELPNPEELEEHKAKAFTRHVALTTAIFAVILAISSLGGSKAMKEMLLSQQQASDQWAFYQAKTIREHFYRGQKERLELDLLEKDTLKPEVKKRYEELLQEDDGGRGALQRREKGDREGSQTPGTRAGYNTAARTLTSNTPRCCCKSPSSCPPSPSWPIPG